jgi:hypothetical protein
MERYSTVQAAKRCGLHPVTLQRWIAGRKFSAPPMQRVGGVVVRLWTNRDVERIRKYKQENYRKGRGCRPKPKR